MDTICKITVYDMEDMSEEKAGAAIDEAFALCAEYEALISATVEGSDIYRINHAGGEGGLRSADGGDREKSPGIRRHFRRQV